MWPSFADYITAVCNTADYQTFEHGVISKNSRSNYWVIAKIDTLILKWWALYQFWFSIWFFFLELSMSGTTSCRFIFGIEFESIVHIIHSNFHVHAALILHFY